MARGLVREIGNSSLDVQVLVFVWFLGFFGITNCGKAWFIIAQPSMHYCLLVAFADAVGQLVTSVGHLIQCKDAEWLSGRITVDGA